MRVLALGLATLLSIALGQFAVAAPGRGGEPQVRSSDLPAAADVIKAVLAAPALVDYEGTKIITAVRGSHVETVTVLESHKRPGTLRLEFLSPESLGGRLIVDDGMTAWQYEPSLHTVIQGPSLGTATGAAAQVGEVLARYKAEVAGAEEVIGRDTVVLELAPSELGVRRWFWVDRTTGVILRTEERTPQEGVIFSAFFTRISYSLNLPAALFTFHLPAGARSYSFYLTGDRVMDPRGLERRAGFPVLVPVTLPMGYRFDHGNVANFGPVTAATATYSDGVSMLTIFQTPTSRMALPQSGSPIRLRVGSGRFLDLGYFRILMWEAHGLRLAAVGPMPAAALVAVAEAIDSVSR